MIRQRSQRPRQRESNEQLIGIFSSGLYLSPDVLPAFRSTYQSVQRTPISAPS